MMPARAAAGKGRDIEFRQRTGAKGGIVQQPEHHRQPRATRSRNADRGQCRPGPAMATQARPDLIVMVSLRDIEGSEATRTLKAPTQTAHILIVMLTVPPHGRGAGTGLRRQLRRL